MPKPFCSGRALALSVLTVLCLAAPLPAFALQPCHPTTTTHERWAVKTRPTPHAPVSAITVTVASLIAMALPNATGTPNTVLQNTPEENVYSLTVYVMLVKRSPDDCDVHLEVADSPDPKAPRVIVEIPPTLKSDQDLVRQILGLSTISTGGKEFTKATARQVHFMGYGFFDLSHAAADGAKEGQGHGSYTTVTKNGKKVDVLNVKTILEVHPVFGVGKVGPPG